MTASAEGARAPVVGSDRREDYLAILGRQRWLVASVALSVLALAAVYSFTRPVLYTAEADILVGSGLQATSGSTAEPNMDTEAQLAASSAVADIAAQSLPIVQDPEKLLNHVDVAVPSNTQILQISFTSRDAAQARQGAQAFADAYLSFRTNQATDQATTRIQELASTERQLKSDISDLSAEVSDPSISDEAKAVAQGELDRKRAQLEFVQSQQLAADTVTIDPGTIVGTPVAPRAPSSPNHRLDLALGLLLGLGLAFALAYVRDRNEQRLEGSAAVERWLDAPVLAVIPKFRKERLWARSGVAHLYAANPAVAEAYRTLRTSILWISRQRRLRSIMVASARAGEGKSTAAAMLSMALASSGKRVILIGADLRAPTVSTYMMVPTWPGLTDLLTGHIDSVQRVLQATDVAGLTVLPSGAMPLDSSPTELLESGRIQTVLEECADADYVIVDVPSVLSVADALVLAPLVDGVLFVAAARRTSPEMVELARVQLERIGANIIGGILVGARSLEGVRSSYYTTGHPGTETVRAAMSRNKNATRVPSEEDAMGGDRARARPDASSERAGSAGDRAPGRAEQRIDAVVSIPSHSEEARTPPPPASTKTNDVSSERHPIEGHQISAPPAQTHPEDLPPAQKRAATSSNDTGPTPQATRPVPKEDASAPGEVTVQVAPPVPREQALPPSQIVPQLPADKATPQVTPAPKEMEDATGPANVAAPMARPAKTAPKKRARHRPRANRAAPPPAPSLADGSGQPTPSEEASPKDGETHPS
jgi:capsular exopolysaccharide synthesis family protein